MQTILHIGNLYDVTCVCICKIVLVDDGTRGMLLYMHERNTGAYVCLCVCVERGGEGVCGFVCVCVCVCVCV